MPSRWGQGGGGGLARLHSVEMSSQNTVSYASRAHSWLRKQPSLPLCVIIFVHRVWCVFAGCVRVISPTRSRRALQAPEITNSRTAARPGWMTVCGYSTTGWHAANHDHVASSRRVQPVPQLYSGFHSALLRGPNCWVLPLPRSTMNCCSG